MNVYRFLGAYSEIGGVVALDSLGQSIKLDPKVAIDAMRGGCVLIPDAEYQKLGFTKDEERQYQYVGTRATAPEATKAKLAAGLKVYQKLVDESYMAELLPPESVPDMKKPETPANPAAPIPAPTKNTEVKQ